MTYLSLMIGIVYLLSCPILVSLNIKEFDYYCPFYLMIPSTSYTLYNIKRIIRESEGATNEITINEKKMNSYIKYFNIGYVVFCVGATILLNKIPIAAFAFFPLIITITGRNLRLILEK